MWPPEYQIKKHRRAKYVKLRAASSRGLIVTVPYRFNVKEIPAILEEHRDWIVKHVIQKQAWQTRELPDKITLLAANQAWPVHYIECQEKLELIQRPTGEIVLVGKISDQEKCRQKLIMWLRSQAKEYLIQLLRQISTKTKLPFETVTIRDQDTLWGSCTSQKAISLNYKLIFLPPNLVEHVMIHELSHTRHLNHSVKFWGLVASHDASWRENRSQLRRADNYIPEWVLER